MQRIAISVFLLSIAACDNPDDPDDLCFKEDPSAIIGTGESSWEDLTEGDPITMVHGPQGGWHILGSARVSHMGPFVAIHYTVTDVASGVRVADNRYNIGLRMNEECTGDFPGMYAYLNVTELAVGDRDTPPELLAYNELELSMTITNDYGHQLVETVKVIAQPDPMDMD